MRLLFLIAFGICSLNFSTLLFGQNPEIIIQSGHSASITKVVYSPDGKMFASLDASNKIIVWQVSTFGSLCEFSPDSLVTAMAFSNNGNYLCIGSDKKVFLYNIISSSIEHSFKVFSMVRGIVPVGNSIVVLAYNLTRFDFAAKESKEISSDSFIAFYSSSESDRIFLCNNDGILSTYNFNTGLLDLFFQPSKKLKRIKSFIVSVNDNSICYLTDDVLGFSKSTLKRVFRRTPDYSEDSYTDFTFSAAQRKIFISGSDNSIYVSSLNGKKDKKLTGHFSSVNSLALSPDGNYLISCSSDRTILVWDLKRNQLITRIYARTFSITNMFSTADREKLVFSDEAGFVKTIDFAGNFPKIKSVRAHADAIGRLVPYGDSSVIAVGDDNYFSALQINSLKTITTRHGFYNSSIENLNVLMAILLGTAIVSDLALENTYFSLVDFFNKNVLRKPWMKGTNFSALHKAMRYQKRNYRKYLKGNLDAALPVLISDKQKFMVSSNQIAFKLDTTAFFSDDLCCTHKSQPTGLGKLNKMNYLFTSSAAGSIKLWNPETDELIVTLVPIDRNKFVFITPDKYYYAPKDAVGIIGFKQGKTLFPAEQFDLKYNRPDIILERMGYSSLDLINSFKNAYKKRLAKLNFTEEMLGPDFHLPTVQIMNKDSLPFVTTNGKISVKILATDSLFMLDRLNVWVNDVPVFGMGGINLRDFKSNSCTKDLELSLIDGTNKIQVSSLNEKGVESVKETVEIKYSPPAKSHQDLYILAIGVSDFSQSEFNLTYAAKDARDIASFFSQSSGIYSDVKKMIITDKEATRDNILKAKDFLKQSTVHDQVIVFIATHGLLDEKLDYYFATSDIDFFNPAIKGVSYDDLEQLVDGIPALKKLVLIDACHSGEFDKSETELSAVNVEMQDEIKFRGFKVLKTKENSLGLKNSFDLMRELFADLRRGSGAVVISSASGVEFAYESKKWNNGVFTFALLEGLKSRHANANNDKNITVSELRDYISQRVQSLTSGKQNPTSRKENFEFDFKIW